MHTFAPEEEHITELRRQLQRFVAQKMPRALRRECDQNHTWPREIFKELADMGLIGLPLRRNMAVVVKIWWLQWP